MQRLRHRRLTPLVGKDAEAAKSSPQTQLSWVAVFAFAQPGISRHRATTPLSHTHT